MPSRDTPLLNGYYYHVFNRVIKPKKLFYSNDDYTYYLYLWREVDFTPCCNLIAYCLIPTHFHYLLQITDRDLFPKKISYFLTRYIKSLHKQRKEGTYFKNRYKAKMIDNEVYLTSLCCYIHLNPIEAKLVQSLDDWPYSNYAEFMGKRKSEFFDQSFFKEYIQSFSNYKNYMSIKYDRAEIEYFVFEND